MAQMKISVSIPHLEKEYDVNVPDTVSGEKLYNALLQRTKDLLESDDGGENVFELFSKRLGKKVYPDYRDVSLKDIGVREGDTIIVKKDLDPGGC
ncbi:MAG: hypothetical protein J5I98_27880 [Phaeodactylibacter sp.]|nr:hypothetical protein [Phaeodactylibacter sp.]